jgi:hypothetical protein
MSSYICNIDRNIEAFYYYKVLFTYYKFLYYYKVLQLYYYKSSDWLLGFYSYLLAGSSAPRAARAGQEKSIGLFPPVAPLTLPAGPPPFSSMNSTPAHSKVVIKQREGTQNSAEVPK